VCVCVRARARVCMYARVCVGSYLKQTLLGWHDSHGYWRGMRHVSSHVSQL